jgi:hypothetical protein
LALGAVALLALPGVASAKHHHGDHARGRHHAHASHAQTTAVEEAATIASFDPTSGKLTIALAGGESITGLVTEDTEIKCEGIDQRRDGGGDQPGDDDGGDSWDSGHQLEEPPATGEEDGDGEGEGEAACTTAALTPGSMIGGAELRIEGGSAVFKEIELGFDS